MADHYDITTQVTSFDSNPLYPIVLSGREMRFPADSSSIETGCAHLSQSRISNDGSSLQESPYYINFITPESGSRYSRSRLLKN
jgi:hypothetical protein